MARLPLLLCFCLLLSLAPAGVVAVWPEQQALDCKLRQFAHEFSMAIRPGSDAQVIADGLELGSLCNQVNSGTTQGPAAPSQQIIDAARFVSFVDPGAGDDDTGDGSRSAPHATVAAGLAALRSARGTSTAAAALVLASGTHEVRETIELTASDSHLSIVAAPGGVAPTLSGGVALGTLTWKKEQGSLYSAKLPAKAGVFDTLYQPNGRRAIRARHPNADPETTNKGQSGICVQASADGYQCPGWIHAAAKWGPAAPLASPPVLERVASPTRANSSDFEAGTVFPYYQLGSGGNLGVFEPPLSFWGMAHPEAGALWNWLTSVSYTAENVSGISVAPPNPANPPIVQAFHGRHWGGWTFAVNGSTTSADGGLTLSFSKGGYQEARGSGHGAESYIENAKGLLDSPREWWLDAESNTLFLMANGTAAPAATGWVASHLETVLHVTGTQAAPVVGHQLVGVSVTHTAPVFLKTYMASLSGGDWSLRPTGALILEGTIDSLVSHCVFNGVGGNGVMIKDFNRNTTVADSEFVWVGESAIVSVGTTEKIDGTKGDQPRGNQILRNLIHEGNTLPLFPSAVSPTTALCIRSVDIPLNLSALGVRLAVGIFGKQTAGYVQAMTAMTTLKHNLMFNGPVSNFRSRPGLHFWRSYPVCCLSAYWPQL
jgi:hypothetical protein